MGFDRGNLRNLSMGNEFWFGGEKAVSPEPPQDLVREMEMPKIVSKAGQFQGLLRASLVVKDLIVLE